MQLVYADNLTEERAITEHGTIRQPGHAQIKRIHRSDKLFNTQEICTALHLHNTEPL